MYVCLAGFMKTVPSDSWSPHTLNWPNQSKYRQETQLLPMVLLRWLSSWFLISKRNIQVHQKDTLDLAIHSSCLQALNDGGCLRLNQVLSREFKVKSPLPDFLHAPPPPQPSTCLRGMISMGLKHYKNLTWQAKGRHDQGTDSPRTRLTEATMLLQHPPRLGIDMEAPFQPLSS